LKIQIASQRAVAGVGTSKSGVGTDEVIHDIMSLSLTKSSYFLQRHHALDADTTNFHVAAIS